MAGANGVRNACFCAVSRFLSGDCAPPVVRLPLSRPAMRPGTGLRRSVRPMRHFRAAPPQQSGSAGKAGREQQGLVHKANGLVGS